MTMLFLNEVLRYNDNISVSLYFCHC